MAGPTARKQASSSANPNSAEPRQPNDDKKSGSPRRRGFLSSPITWSLALFSLGAGYYVFSNGIGSGPTVAISPQHHGERNGIDLVLGAACRAKPGASDSERYGPGKGGAPSRWCSVSGCDCGEDAYYITNNKDFAVLGVLDGVGGWNNRGVNPALFSWWLANAAKQEADASDHVPDPVKLLDLSYRKLVDSNEVKAGSSTACFLAIEKASGHVATANLGDSGYIILRPLASTPEVVYRSKEQTKRFNHPFQLSVLPSEYRRPGQILDMPSDSQRAEHKLVAGDVVVVGSDGLFDNLFDHEILKVVTEERNKHRNDDAAFAQAASDRLLKDARTIAGEKYRTTPFSQGAKEAGYKFQGGKMDDITVVTGIVVDRFKDEKPTQ